MRATPRRTSTKDRTISFRERHRPALLTLRRTTTAEIRDGDLWINLIKIDVVRRASIAANHSLSVIDVPSSGATPRKISMRFSRLADDAFSSVTKATADGDNY